MKTLETEVLVIGASASGTAAAIQAARMGSRVVLVEEGPWVGGMLSSAGVSAIDGNHRLPAGLWGEFRAFVREYYGGADRVETGWVSNTSFEPHVAARILENLVTSEPRISLFRGWWCNDVLTERNPGTGRRRITGAVFRDATGASFRVDATITILADEYGDALVSAGIPWRTGLEGRMATGEAIGPEEPYARPQDLTYVATLAIPPRGFAGGIPAPIPPLDSEFAHILGPEPLSWDQFFDYGRLPNHLMMLNWPIGGNDYFGEYLDHDRRAAVVDAARDKTLRLVRFLQRTFGADRVRLCTVALIPYIREARRIYGMQTLALSDLTAPEASSVAAYGIAVGDYPLDHHRSEDPDAPTLEFPAVHAFSVPYGCLVPREFDGVLVAEKSISVTGIVNGCTRLQPVVMQIGQAAGAAAALCVSGSVEPRSLDVRALQSVLLAARGYLAPTHDATPDDAAFEALQWAVTTGALALRRSSEGWANRAYVEPDGPSDCARFCTRREYAIAQSQRPREPLYL